MSDWQEERLDAHLTRITYGFTNPMPTTDVGPYMVTARDVNDGRILYEQARRTSSDAYRNELTDKSRPEIGDVLVTKDGTLGRIAVVDRDDICINQSVALLKPAQTIRSRFLKYLLEEPRNHSRMLGDADGTTIKHIYVTRLAKMPVRVPTLTVQDKILDALGSLDDKIELNRRMNETLEAIAQVIFRDWFVDFGPTRRKIDGATDPVEIMGGLVSDPDRARELAALFPAKLGDDGLPEGWREGSLGDVASSVGTSVSPAQISPDTPYIGLEHMPRRSIALAEWEAVSKVSSNKSAFHRGQILFGKLRPYFHKVGIAPVDGVCSTDIIVLDAIERCARPMVIACVSTDEFVAFTDQGATGTKMPRTSWGNMKKYQIALAPRSVMEQYGSLATPMMDKIVAGIHEHRTLAATRDLLLPKLMSGEIRLRDAEAELEIAQ